MSVRNDFSTDIDYDAYLDEGEHILWSQVPDKKKFHLPQGIIPVVLSLVFIIAGSYVLKIQHDKLVDFLYGLVFIIFGMVALFNYIERSATYLFTDKRIFIFKATKYKEIRYHNISFISVEKKKDSDTGNISLCFTHLLNRPHHQREYKVTSQTIYDVQDCEKVAEIIKAQKDTTNAYKKAREIEREQGF
ncbi:PH domain-containing protein [Ruminococcus flavefaciens]|uniref:YokE-like PH domain-containing protein n=1 Tax=Ruminococcus flavefaciens TaxID=1265 RepID=A0A1M7MF78_RUMFL|nr:PH domain-containing protein [Ruminococcus flavefaciens]SHM89473.1 hypothetical protein SAMN04487860_1229 [Ruminococcus flavefaciens]